MNLLVISHKETWADPRSPSGYCTVGGFPFQMRALSEEFDQTTLLVLQRKGPPPAGALPLQGHNLSVHTLPEPPGRNWGRKLSLIFWLPRHLPALRRMIRQADAVHTPVPGDLGEIGMCEALRQKKRLYVRHCGRWGIPSSFLDAWLQRFLTRQAGGRLVVMATGGSSSLPSAKNPNITWIFSSSLTRNEMDHLPAAHTWQPGDPLRLVSVGRLLPGKNFTALIEALLTIQGEVPAVTLDIFGSGSQQSELEALAQKHGVEGAVRFHGNLPHSDVLRHLAEAHIFVFPTFSEGFPKALLEAMACGLVVVASPVSVIPHLLAGEAGLLLDGFSAEDISRAVLSLVQVPEQMKTLGGNARSVARQYTLEAWGDCIRDRLERAWGEKLRSSVGGAEDE